jgi:hypothetical protein
LTPDRNERPSSLFPFLRQAVALRVQPRNPGTRDAFDRNRVTIPLDEAQALVRLIDAAQECADWHMGRATKHITDVALWEAVTGRERRASYAKNEPVSVDIDLDEPKREMRYGL